MTEHVALKLIKPEDLDNRNQEKIVLVAGPVAVVVDEGQDTGDDEAVSIGLTQQQVPSLFCRCLSSGFVARRMNTTSIPSPRVLLDKRIGQPNIVA